MIPLTRRENTGREADGGEEEALESSISRISSDLSQTSSPVSTETQLSQELRTDIVVGIHSEERQLSMCPQESRLYFPSSQDSRALTEVSGWLSQGRSVA